MSGRYFSVVVAFVVVVVVVFFFFWGGGGGWRGDWEAFFFVEIAFPVGSAIYCK